MLVIAHRGASQSAPENTLPAIKKAMYDKTDGIEIDVQLTKDKEVVVFHDEWVNRTTNGKGFICDLTYEKLQRLDAGSWFHPKFQGTKIPLLREVLELIQGQPILLNIELKNNLIPYPGLEEKTIQLIKQYHLEEQVLISSFKKESLKRCQQLAPEIKRGLVCWHISEPQKVHTEWKSLELYSLHLPVALVNRKVKLWQALGYKVFPYVVESKDQLKLCVYYQVDGFFTNTPRSCKKMLQYL